MKYTQINYNNRQMNKDADKKYKKKYKVIIISITKKVTTVEVEYNKVLAYISALNKFLDLKTNEEIKNLDIIEI